MRPTARYGLRCPGCHRKRPRYDRGSGSRRWRSMDFGPMRVYLEADAPRIKCKTHGVRVAEVPWARPRSRYTYQFENEVAWLASQASKTAVCDLQRMAWRSVGRVIERVVAAALDGGDNLDGLRRISIDEKSYRKGHRYLTVVTNLETSRLVWAAEGRRAAVVHEFFDDLGPERSARLAVVARDASQVGVGAGQGQGAPGDGSAWTLSTWSSG
ncbi:MAG: transposase family protein [Acidimicrobiia bacterium]